jgi:indolepyruvate ferredoxin oxidoreductase
MAYQCGALPLSAASIERAIELNGVAVERNTNAFRWGRRWVVEPAEVERAAGVRSDDHDVPAGEVGVPRSLRPLLTPFAERTRLPDMVTRRAVDLVGYQSTRYAKRYLTDLIAVLEAEQSVAALSDELTEAAATHLYQLMAYKDEYEVARLLRAPEARAAAEAVGGPGARVRWHLHPPVLRALGMRRKIRVGRWASPLLGLLAAGRRVRGTVLDPFAWAKVRRVERALLREYRRALTVMSGSLTAANLAEARRIASLPDTVRGYEDLKLQRAALYRAEIERSLQRFAAGEPLAATR